MHSQGLALKKIKREPTHQPVNKYPSTKVTNVCFINLKYNLNLTINCRKTAEHKNNF